VLTERLAGWLRRMRGILNVLDLATDYDPYADYRRHLSAIEERLNALEQSRAAPGRPANHFRRD